MIDMWLFFASNVLVITMAFHTYLAFIVERAKKKMDGRYIGSALFKMPKVLQMRKSKKKTNPGEISDSSLVSSETIKVATVNGNDLVGQVLI